MTNQAGVAVYLVVYGAAVLMGLGHAKERPDKKMDGCNSLLSFSSNRHTSEGNGNIHTQSLSPWTWKPTTVQGRIPSTIWEAKCSSSYCLDPNQSQPNMSSYNSVAIYQHVLVLNRKGKEKCYTTSYLLVAVGCTCVRARVS
ncbi:interleukin 17a/f2 [Lampris incognitus]|uniref:interleukin 17a/f2 n=1 Tax=Lampris incognitus TaxID=2546036 RepID=UPI0024B53498|nr:interleukin 17a/f2 [Lampris incognitus]